MSMIKDWKIRISKTILQLVFCGYNSPKSGMIFFFSPKLELIFTAMNVFCHVRQVFLLRRVPWFHNRLHRKRKQVSKNLSEFWGFPIKRRMSHHNIKRLGDMKIFQFTCSADLSHLEQDWLIHFDGNENLYRIYLSFKFPKKV